MVPADDDLVAMGQNFEEIIEAGHILNRPAHGHVSGKDQEIGIGDPYLLMQHVGVAEGGCSHDGKGLGSGLDFIYGSNINGLCLIIVLRVGGYFKFEDII